MEITEIKKDGPREVQGPERKGGIQGKGQKHSCGRRENQVSRDLEGTSGIAETGAGSSQSQTGFEEGRFDFLRVLAEGPRPACEWEAESRRAVSPQTGGT